MSTATITNLAQFQTDIANLVAAVNTNSQELITLEGIVTTQGSTIADLNNQIASLKANNPTLDLSQLEASLATLQEANTQAATSISNAQSASSTATATAGSVSSAPASAPDPAPSSDSAGSSAASGS